MRVAALVFRDDRGHDGVAAGEGDADPQDALLIFSQVGKFVLHCPVFFWKSAAYCQKISPA